MNNEDIVAKPADKWGAIVLMDKNKYLEEVHIQLVDKEVYRKVDSTVKKLHYEMPTGLDRPCVCL